MTRWQKSPLATYKLCHSTQRFTRRPLSNSDGQYKQTCDNRHDELSWRNDLDVWEVRFFFNYIATSVTNTGIT